MLVPFQETCSYYVLEIIILHIVFINIIILFFVIVEENDLPKI
jgi:hypothetical protein